MKFKSEDYEMVDLSVEQARHLIDVITEGSAEPDDPDNEEEHKAEDPFSDLTHALDEAQAPVHDGKKEEHFLIIRIRK